ncbi:Hypothetical protein NTJ_06441 [Nesidiocoris tenuis]|nr:Hypothetical protein NTJ_06441 [Nesidiocoris tenuis]
MAKSMGSARRPPLLRTAIPAINYKWLSSHRPVAHYQPVMWGKFYNLQGAVLKYLEAEIVKPDNAEIIQLFQIPALPKGYLAS